VLNGRVIPIFGGEKMKKAYSNVAKFVRWAVAGILSAIVALPAIFSLNASM
jgi:hypothetical protein